MPTSIDLYDHAYGNYEQNVYRQVRMETYGHDLGQTSWVTSEESETIPRWLDINRDTKVLEIGFGSGRYSLHLAQQTDCQLVGLDINAHGVQSARQLARQMNLESRVEFRQHDVRESLPFENETFDVMFSNDVLCHVDGRERLLLDVYRVLNRGGRLAFSDALVVAGSITNQEFAARSSIGFYSFSPPGFNETLLDAAGFRLTQVMDTTAGAATIAKRWHDARARWERELLAFEGEKNYSGLQQFLLCAYQLTSERRLLRMVYVAEKQ